MPYLSEIILAPVTCNGGGPLCHETVSTEANANALEVLTGQHLAQQHYRQQRLTDVKDKVYDT